MRDSMPPAVIKHDLSSFTLVPVKSVKYAIERSRAGPHVRPGFMDTVVCGDALHRFQARTVALQLSPGRAVEQSPDQANIQPRLKVTERMCQILCLCFSSA